MDFKSLYCFAELIRLQSFSATASALNLTQPTVSKIIQALEEELGVPLLCKENGRKKRQVQPTAIGEEVYCHALNLLHERDLLLARIDDYRHVKSGTLRLGLALFGSDLLSHALFDFHQKWPDIELSFLEQGSLAIEQSLRNNDVLFEIMNTLCARSSLIVAVSDPLRKEKRNIDSNSHHEHREILDLLLAGKRNRVTKVIRRHLGACMERLEQKLEM